MVGPRSRNMHRGARYGMGPGAMGDHRHGYGMGPGMMGGNGPGYGMGMGMSPGAGGYGTGMGMGMGGYGMGMGMGPGSYGMGCGAAGTMDGSALGWLDLDQSQRKQLRDLREQQWRQHWTLMGQMHEERAKLRDAWFPESGTRDRAAILAAWKSLSSLQQQGLESQLDAADQLDRILTPEQREQLRSGSWERSGR